MSLKIKGWGTLARQMNCKLLCRRNNTLDHRRNLGHLDILLSHEFKCLVTLARQMYCKLLCRRNNTLDHRRRFRSQTYIGLWFRSMGWVDIHKASFSS